MIKAVITGDIIHSSKMSSEDREKLFKLLADWLKELNKDYKTKSEMFRGDSFQCYLNEPKHALRVALLIKTYIRGLNPSEAFELKKRKNPREKIQMLYPRWIFDARIAIGIGAVDRQAKTLGASHGDAYTLSGHLLDELKKLKQYFSIASDDKYRDELKTESMLLDNIISKTTALQCEVINWKLLGYTEMEIAKNLDIMQSAVNQRSNSGSWNAITAMVERFENIYSHE